MSTKSLYVGNISYQATDEDLKTYFEPYGPVTEVRIVQGRGFGFVDVPTEKMAEAIEQTNGKDLQGRTIVVSEAKPKENRSSGGGSYGGSGRSGSGYNSSGGGGNRW